MSSFDLVDVTASTAIAAGWAAWAVASMVTLLLAGGFDWGSVLRRLLVGPDRRNAPRVNSGRYGVSFCQTYHELAGLEAFELGSSVAA